MVKKIDSSPPSVTYMCQWIRSTLVQIMACSLFGVLSDGPLGTKLQWNFNQNTKFFIHKNASENMICGHFVQMAAILSSGRWVNKIVVSHISLIHYTSSFLFLRLSGYQLVHQRCSFCAFLRRFQHSNHHIWRCARFPTRSEMWFVWTTGGTTVKPLV